MKPTIPLCLALLLSLTACGGQSVSAPSPTPEPSAPASPMALSAPLPSLIPLDVQVTEAADWELDSGQFPTQPVDGQAELSRLFGENESGIVLLSELPDDDTALYGLWDNAHEQEGLVLRVGEQWEVYELYWYTPRCYLPELYSGDFDGDGDAELALLTYTGSGTGVSAWSLSIAELEGETWALHTLPDYFYDMALPPYLTCSYEKAAGNAAITLGEQSLTVDLSDYDLTGDSELEAYAGTIVEYEINGGDISVQTAVGLCGMGLPYTACYFADLQAQVVYDGGSFFLSQPTLSAY